MQVQIRTPAALRVIVLDLFPHLKKGEDGRLWLIISQSMFHGILPGTSLWKSILGQIDTQCIFYNMDI